MKTGRDSTDSRSGSSKRELILCFFSEQLGRKFRTDDLHLMFGTSFRTRVSELNRDSECPIRIQNHTERPGDGRDASHYWGVRRAAPAPIAAARPAESLFGDLGPEGSYPD
jgi:hypothetical protein